MFAGAYPIGAAGCLRSRHAPRYAAPVGPIAWGRLQLAGHFCLCGRAAMTGILRFKARIEPVECTKSF